MSRRALSEAANVSPRYLAQLETGSGNISVTLLSRVATALGQDLSALLSFDHHDDTVLERISVLLPKADFATRMAVMSLLERRVNGTQKAERLCLIGLRGAGKSTLGRLAGRALGVPFVELNEEIELLAHMPVSEVFSLYGEEGYRALEAQALSRVVENYPAVILAVAGGIVEEATTFQSMLRQFHSIWLKARPEEHMTRVRAQGDERPMAGNPQAMRQLRIILSRREFFYQQADDVLNTSDMSLEQSVQDVLKLAIRFGITASEAKQRSSRH